MQSNTQLRIMSHWESFPFSDSILPPLPLQLIGGQSTLCPIVLSVSNYFSLEYQISQEFIASCLWDTSNNKKIIDIDKDDLDQSMYKTRIHSLLKKQKMILEPRILIVIDPNSPLSPSILHYDAWHTQGTPVAHHCQCTQPLWYTHGTPT